jgi:hypothetical protein
MSPFTPPARFLLSIAALAFFLSPQILAVFVLDGAAEPCAAPLDTSVELNH